MRSQARDRPSVVVSTPFRARYGYDPFSGQWPRAAQEERVASSMATRGFRYVPRPDDTPAVFGTGTRADVERHGYGITMDMFTSASPTKAADPNDQIVNALSSAERTAYELAFVGPTRARGEQVDPDHVGCVPKAQLELYGFEGAFPPALEQLVAHFVATVASSPTVVAQTALWRKCLREVGYAVETRLAAVKDLEGRRDALLYPSGTGAVGVANGLAEPGGFAALQDYERRLASADYICDRSAGLGESQRLALAAAEGAYIDEHPGFDLLTLAGAG